MRAIFICHPDTAPLTTRIPCRRPLADWVVLSTDPRSVPVDQMKDVAVEMTVVGELIVYNREGTQFQTVER